MNDDSKSKEEAETRERFVFPLRITMRTRVLLINAYPIIRHGLKRLLQQDDFTVVGEAATLDEALPEIRRAHPDVVVLDLAATRLQCMAAVREIGQAAPEVRVLSLAFSQEEYLVTTAFRTGIRGYVMKTRAVEELSPAVRAVAGGDCYVSPDLLPAAA
jgi:DNA-binding NarL/FixJ family response regulator